VVYYILNIGLATATTFISRFELLLVDIFVGVATFVAIARYLGANEIDVVVKLLFEKLQRGPNTPSPTREAPIA
jgi:hypothetical protein